MESMRKFSCLAFSFVFLPILSANAAEKNSLTIYSTVAPGSLPPSLYRPSVGVGAWANGNQVPGYATIREEREITLKSGANDIKFTDVPALIDPTTVTFKSLTDPTGTSVVEQDYHFDLVSSQKLLERYLGQDITVDQVQGTGMQNFSGKLLSAGGGGLILQDQAGKITTINNYADIHFPELPGGLIVKPTLLWNVTADKPGKQTIETSYKTEGITWWADYNALYTENKNGDGGVIDLGAWVTIVNKSGASYDEVGLKLVAGDVHQVQPEQQSVFRAQSALAASALATPTAGFAEKSFFEFHLYTLGRSTAIPDNSTKQIELFPEVTHVPVEKQFVYISSSLPFYGTPMLNRDYGNQGNKKIDVYLKFKNDKKAGLGIPLPAGRVRVSKQDDADGATEFIGEDVIDHTPKDEDVLIKMGEAFDIVGERKQTDFRLDNEHGVLDETFEITLSNHKDNDVNVIVKENMYRMSNWEITNSSEKYEKVDAHTVRFPVSVDKNGTTKFQYTVHYTWGVPSSPAIPPRGILPH